MKKVRHTFLLFLCSFLFMYNLQAQDVIYHSDALEDDEFGYTVSIHGDYAAVCAERSDALGQQSGAVYIFHFDGMEWQETQKITANDGTAWDYFGAGLQIHENYLIIGNYFDDDMGMNSGSAYIYKRNGTTWDFETKILADDGSAADWFGLAVDINDEYAVAGARGDDAAASLNNKAGAAYIFKNNNDGTWTQVQKVYRDTPNNVDEFGTAVAIDGDYVFVGSPRQEHSQGHRGSVYIYKKNGTGSFDFIETLENPEGTSNDQFGLRIDASADRLIVSTQKTAEIFSLENDNWIFETELLPPVNASSVGYVDVRIYNDYALINNYISALQGPPSVHLFTDQNGSWELVETFSGSSSGQRFSHSFDLHSGRIIVGSPRNDDQGDNAGAIFTFDFFDNTPPPTSIQKISEMENISVFPNPAVDFININSTDEIQSVQVFNLIGQLVLQENYNQQIDVSNIPSGGYILKLKKLDGNYLVGKFLK